MSGGPVEQDLPEAVAKRKKPLPAGLDLKAIDLKMPLTETGIIRKLLYVLPSMRAIGSRSPSGESPGTRNSRPRRVFHFSERQRVPDAWLFQRCTGST